jgi:hypothetical protein
MPSPSTNSAKAMVATPLGPNQAMKPLVTASTSQPASAIQIAIGRASSRVNATMPTPAGRSAAHVQLGAA